MTAPVDATTTPAWAALAQHHAELTPDLRGWFAADPDRVEAMTFTAADLYVDLSKNLATTATLDQLVTLAEEVGLPARMEAMFRGEHINVTEDRAVLHTALRRPPGLSPHLEVDGQDVDVAVHGELAKVYSFATKVRDGSWTGATGRPIATIVNIGIGGSDLGPVMAYEALKPYAAEQLEARFISNIDPTDVAETVRDLDPATTLFIVASKTFGTLETLTNARLARAWLLDTLREAGSIDGSEAARNDAVAKHFVAVSTALDKVAAFGIDPANAFGFWDWVGGRYSVDSAIGTSLAVVFGTRAVRRIPGRLPRRGRALPDHPAAPERPRPDGSAQRLVRQLLRRPHPRGAAVRPVPEPVPGLPPAVDDGVERQVGALGRFTGRHRHRRGFLGRTRHQRSTRLLPTDPSGHPAHPGRLHQPWPNPANPLVDHGAPGAPDVHELFLANFFAQTKALAFGKTADEVRAEGTPEAIVPARVFSGNRPTTSIMAPALTPSVLGQLIALYEHITFTQGVVWGIDSFDQWGGRARQATGHRGDPCGRRRRRGAGRPGCLHPRPDRVLPGPPHALRRQCRSVEGRVGRVGRQPRHPARLRPQDLAPQALWVRAEHVVGPTPHDQPGTLVDLGLQLATGPPGVTGEHPQPVHRAADLVGVTVQIDQGDAAGAVPLAHRPQTGGRLVRVEQPGQAERAVQLNRPAPKDHARVGRPVVPARQHLSDRGTGRHVDHHSGAARLLVGLEQIDHASSEVLVHELREGKQHPPGRRGDQGRFGKVGAHLPILPR